ncbi:hypothetical protein B0O99DRAFT_688786 [Bisporella sp. PMI_857]|nr:hypothetical protein B0O99DRAFT_688786 [Bisporella sp. PMI_857]
MPAKHQTFTTPGSSACSLSLSRTTYPKSIFRTDAMSEQPVTNRASSCGVGESCNSVEKALAVLRLESRNGTSMKSASDGIDLAHVTNIGSNPEALRGMGKPTAIASPFASSEDTRPIFTAKVLDITGNSSDIPPSSTGSKDTNSATKTFSSSDPALADNDVDDIDNSPQVLLEYRPRADSHAASRIKNQWDWLKWLYNPNTSPDFSEIEHLGYGDIVLTPQQAAPSGEFPDDYQVPSQKVPLHDIEIFGRRLGSITDTYPRHDISHEQPHHASGRGISNNGVTQPLEREKIQSALKMTYL